VSELILIGDFDGLGAPSASGSIELSRDYLDAIERDLVVRYLLGGVAVSSVPGRQADAIDGSEVSMTPSLRTDGRFIWRADLAHYVKRYGVKLPPDFLSTVLAGATPAGAAFPRGRPRIDLLVAKAAPVKPVYGRA
jgi:hypothetical protein